MIPARDQLASLLTRAHRAAHPPPWWKRLGIALFHWLLLPFVLTVAPAFFVAAPSVLIWLSAPNTAGCPATPALLVTATGVFLLRSVSIAAILKGQRAENERAARFLPVSPAERARRLLRITVLAHAPVTVEAALLASLASAGFSHAFPTAVAATALTFATAFLLTLLPFGVLLTAVGIVAFATMVAVPAVLVPEARSIGPSAAAAASCLHPATFALSLNQLPVALLAAIASIAVGTAVGAARVAARAIARPTREPLRRPLRPLPARRFVAPVEALLSLTLSLPEKRLARALPVRSHSLTTCWLVGTALVAAAALAPIPLPGEFRWVVRFLTFLSGAVFLAPISVTAGLLSPLPFLPHRLADHTRLALKTIALRSLFALLTVSLAITAAWPAGLGSKPGALGTAGFIVAGFAALYAHTAIPPHAGTNLPQPRRALTMAAHIALGLAGPLILLFALAAFRIQLEESSIDSAIASVVGLLRASVPVTFATLALRLVLTHRAYARNRFDLAYHPNPNPHRGPQAPPSYFSPPALWRPDQ